MAHEQRQRLETVKDELVGLKQWLDRLYRAIETTDLNVADISPRIKEHRERQERLEVAAAEARLTLSEHRTHLEDVETITAFAEDMSEFLKTSELTETRAFVHSFVKEIEVKPGKAAIVYSIPTPEDSPIGRADATEVALNRRVRSTVRHGGPGAARPRSVDALPPHQQQHRVNSLLN